MELFSTTKAEWVPLAKRLLPSKIGDFFGQEHLLGREGSLRLALEAGQPMSAIFFGPPGAGKTSLAHLMARSWTLDYVEISCASSGLPKIREAIGQAEMRLKTTGRTTLLVLDEIHHLNRTQQDILLPYMESGVIALVAMTTENPFFYIHKAILSRALVFEFKSLTDGNLAQILSRALKILSADGQSLGLKEESQEFLAHFAAGDARRLLNTVEFLSRMEAKAPAGGWVPKDLERLLGRRQVLYDKKEDNHYDVASALIKSMRGSDPDAAVYWLARMLEGGEDPRFIARRIVIAASEDVGNADSMALVVAQSAFNAVEMLGLPEGAIPLAHAAIYVACAPKSNAAYLALKAAQEEVSKGKPQEVPAHLKDANLDAVLGHGKGYLYAHDHPDHFVNQKYMEKFIQFYHPTVIGAEATIKERLEKFWKRNYEKN
ncbi:MAG: replication-associated recombination protein A [Elusimicrobia bacterium]|nr:replication-associated recombination protein A [Elusimicrobiota bacterium]